MVTGMRVYEEKVVTQKVLVGHEVTITLTPFQAKQFRAFWYFFVTGYSGSLRDVFRDINTVLNKQQVEQGPSEMVTIDPKGGLRGGVVVFAIDPSVVEND